jgi:hypothetical protein
MPRVRIHPLGQGKTRRGARTKRNLRGANHEPNVATLETDFHNLKLQSLPSRGKKFPKPSLTQTHGECEE